MINFPPPMAILIFVGSALLAKILTDRNEYEASLRTKIRKLEMEKALRRS